MLDTWFSSALWPFSTLGWPDKTPELSAFYPTSVLVTGWDIIFFWVARMIMMGLKFAGDVPFRDVYIHALIRDSEGQKMSKSKGNILDPIDLIDGVDLDTLLKKRTDGLMQPSLQKSIERTTRKEFPEGIEAYGTDALRLTFASLVTTGRDVRFDLSRAEGYHRFCNKLWNASAYVFGQLGDFDAGRPVELATADSWIRSRLRGVVESVHDSFAAYRFDVAIQTLYDFTWHEFCDWYLELTKAVLTDPAADPALRRGAQSTLLDVLAAVLKLLHPLMPFVTEELWLELAKQRGWASATLMLERFPEPQDVTADAGAEQEIEWLKGFVGGIRQLRGESNLPRSVRLTALLADASHLDRARAERYTGQLRKLAGIERIDFVPEGSGVKGAATALLGAMRSSCRSRDSSTWPPSGTGSANSSRKRTTISARCSASSTTKVSSPTRPPRSSPRSTRVSPSSRSAPRSSSSSSRASPSSPNAPKRFRRSRCWPQAERLVRLQM